MHSFIVECLIILVLIVLGFFPINKKCSERERNIGFMSMDYTTIAKGIFILMVVVHHTSTRLGFRYLTPMGGGRSSGISNGLWLWIDGIV